MTENEIIKALECCTTGKKCRECIMKDEDSCMSKIRKNALALINRQKAEIDILIRKKDTLRDEIAEQQAEIERYLHSIKLLEKDVADAREETVKAFAHLLVDKSSNGIIYAMDLPEHILAFETEVNEK